MAQGISINNRYRLLEQIGEGGMGAVFKAHDRLEKQDVALKQVQLSPYELAFASKPGTDDTGKLRSALAREFRILAGLRHPYIVSVLDYGFDEKQVPYYTMDFIEQAQTITDYAAGRSDEEKVRLLIHSLEALTYLHRRRIIHRDLKPSNILVKPDGSVQVMDFGISRSEQSDSDSTDEGTLVGTFAYMAPELYVQEKASVASDLYALGVIAYQVFVGQMPYPSKNIGATIASILNQKPDTNMLENEAQAAWLQRLLNKNPQARYPDAHSALIGLCQAMDVPLPPESQQVRESFLQASTFVGREAELGQLTDALKTLDTKNAFFLIGGESGVGKSRLLDEVRIQALVKGVTVLRGQAVEGGGLPFQLWRDIVRRLLLLVNVNNLQAGILKDLVPDVSDLLGRGIPDAPELTGSAQQQRIVLAIVDLLRGLQQPILLLLEDVQWAVQSLAPLKQILLVREQLPKLMIIASYRADEAPNLAETLADMTTIALERLNERLVGELSAAMLGDAGADEEIIRLLHRESEGNTFFIVETVRAMAEESGGLQKVSRTTLTDGVLTGGMQAITRRRLNKVDAQYAEIQRLAAVIGREIDAQLLARAHNEATVKAWLNNAAEYGVVSIRDNVWRFAHDKLRETLIADLPAAALPNIHRSAAESIEAVYPDDDGYNESLLMHWRAAGDLDKELQYLEPVARHMITIQGAYDKAGELLNAALERLSSDDARRIAFLNLLARKNDLQGQYTVATRYVKSARSLAERVDDQNGLAQSMRNLGKIALNQGEYELAAELSQQSLTLFQQLGDQLGIAESLNNLGLIELRQGDYARATDLYRQSLAIRQKLGDQPGIATIFGNLGVIAIYQGDYAQATDLLEQGLAIQQDLGDQRGIAMSLGNLGIMASWQGDYDRATDLYQQSLAIQQQLGDQHNIAMNLLNLGVIAKAQGNYARATDLFQQSLSIRQDLGDQLGIAQSLNNLSVTAKARGDHTQATDLLQQSLEIQRQLGDQHGIAMNLHVMGRIAQEQGQVAVRWFHQSLEIAHTIQGLPLLIANMLGFAVHLAGQGQHSRAARYAGLAQSHSAQDDHVREVLAELIPLLEAALPPDELSAALERGTALDLD
ncbi:MAG: tetratricopeptide repeat protein, partial [Chloroflexi bacterium]|nr:tetratricopeptide repeat protein [Chloroflexota bacterium]